MPIQNLSNMQLSVASTSIDRDKGDDKGDGEPLPKRLHTDEDTPWQDSRWKIQRRCKHVSWVCGPCIGRVRSRQVVCACLHVPLFNRMLENAAYEDTRVDDFFASLVAKEDAIDDHVHNVSSTEWRVKTMKRYQIRSLCPSLAVLPMCC